MIERVAAADETGDDSAPAGLVTTRLIVPAVVRKLAGSDAVICVALSLLTESVCPFACTVAPVAKFDPLSEMVAGPAGFVITAMLDGLTEATTGCAPSTSSSVGVVALPPGPGLLTVIWPRPKVCTSVAVSATCSDVALTNVVGRVCPFHNTVEFASNPVPATVTTAGAPCGTLAGINPAIAGVGLITVKPEGAELPPPGAGFTTVIDVAAPAASAAAGTVTCNTVALTNLVANAVPLNEAVEVAMNPLPLSVTTCVGAPATTLVGDTPDTAGVGFAAGVGVGVGAGEAVPLELGPPPQPESKGKSATRNTAGTKV